MAKFRCKNDECPNIDRDILVGQVSFTFDNELKKLVVRSKQYCSICGKELEYVEEPPKTKVEGFCFTRFNTMSSDQKKEVIKKRSKKHFDKHERRDIEERKRQIIEDNRRMAEGRLK